MKTSILSRFLLVLLIITFIGCSESSSDDDSSNQNPELDLLRAKIDGVNYEFVAWAWEFQDTVRISGCQNPWLLSLNFPNSVGTMTLTSAFIETEGCCILSDCNPAVKYNVTEGFVTVTEATETKIKGTFNFTGESGQGGIRAITEGVFDIEY